MDTKDYVSYKAKGDYAGAEEMLEQEWQYLEDKRENFQRDNIKGIALSGGGIRSASFCLGVMQALASKDKLQQFDYLSTVSGGGYLGGALSWLWSGLWKDKGSQSPSFGVGKDDFPFGTGGRKFGGSEEDKDLNRLQASLMRHLRQNGKYLTPGHGITALSFFSIILRSIVMGFVSLMVLSSFVFTLFYAAGWFHSFEKAAIEGKKFVSAFTDAGAWFIVFGYLTLHFLYMLYLAWQKKNNESAGEYRWRRTFERLIPYPLIAALLCYLLAAIHWVQLEIYGSAVEVGGVAALLGSLFGSVGKDSKWRKLWAIIPHHLQMVMGAALMIFGLLVLADHVANLVYQQHQNAALWMTGLSALVVIIIAWVLPINNISIHRYYRDRLMETFMPDAENVFNSGKTHEAIKANATGVHLLGLGDQQQAPYHLINTNVILVESNIAKFRGRGGDNFILSPKFCGSNATGWRNSEKYNAGKITIPTAVAISGAAANPDAGVSGKGLTTNVIISILMSIFNLRLGYWACNPDPKCQKNQGHVPNYLAPGFSEVIKRKDMNEKGDFVQLSDGGHFENLALYELFRRRARLIVVCDAGEDHAYEFSDLANALEKARVDFGVRVDLKRENLDCLVPATDPEQSAMDYPVSEQGFVVADVHYNDGSQQPAKLVYIKTTLPKQVSADVHGYKRVHPDFPDQTTIDQFFDEVQFEAYRELGWQIASQMLADKKAGALF